MYNIIASVILGFMALYLTCLGILYNLYLNARYKIEESCKYFASDYKYIPTEEQVKLLEQEMARLKQNNLQVNDKRVYYYDINITRYKLVTIIIKIITFGKFKHVV